MDTGRPITVLYVTYGLEPGGAERVVLSLASRLDRRKYRPLVCSLRKGGSLVADFEANDVKVVITRKKRGFDASVLARMKQLIIEERVGVVHSHNFSANFWGRLAGRWARVPIMIASEHTLASDKSPLQQRADAVLCKWTDKIIAVSESVRRAHIATCQIPPDRITTVYNGIDLHEADTARPRHEVRTELGLPGDSPVVAIVGRLAEAKGYRFFLEAAGAVASVLPKTRFLIIGDGPLRETLTETTNRLGLEKHVMFLGYRKDRLDVLNVCDVAVLSSVREGLPIALLEYMLLKKPIVATHVGGVPEAIQDGVTGLLVPPSESGRLALKILDLLCDPTTASRLGLRAHQRLQESFSEDMMVAKTQEVYDSFVCGKTQ